MGASSVFLFGGGGGRMFARASPKKVLVAPPSFSWQRKCQLWVSWNIQSLHLRNAFMISSISPPEKIFYEIINKITISQIVLQEVDSKLGTLLWKYEHMLWGYQVHVVLRSLGQCYPCPTNAHLNSCCLQNQDQYTYQNYNFKRKYHKVYVQKCSIWSHNHKQFHKISAFVLAVSLFLVFKTTTLMDVNVSSIHRSNQLTNKKCCVPKKVYPIEKQSGVIRDVVPYKWMCPCSIVTSCIHHSSNQNTIPTQGDST